MARTVKPCASALAGALFVAFAASAADVKLRATGSVVIRDPDAFITANPHASGTLGNCNKKGWNPTKVRHARVQLRREKFGPTNPVVAEGFTAEDGTFTLDRLPDGTPALGPADGSYYAEVLTQDTQRPTRRIDVHDLAGNTYRLESKRRGVTKGSNVIDLGVVDFAEAKNDAIGCAGVILVHAMLAYDGYVRLTGQPQLKGDNGNLSITYGFGTNGMWTYWNNIRIERTITAWDLQSIYHEFGHRIAFGADSPNGPTQFLDDAARFNYARNHTGLEVSVTGEAWSEGWADFNHEVLRPKIQRATWDGFTGDGVNTDVEGDVATKLFQYALQCGGVSASDDDPTRQAKIGAAYKGFVATLVANPGADIMHRASSKGIHSFASFAAHHKQRTGCAFTPTAAPAAHAPKVTGHVVKSYDEACHPQEAVQILGEPRVDGAATLINQAQYSVHKLVHPTGFKWQCGTNSPETTQCSADADQVLVRRSVKATAFVGIERNVHFDCYSSKGGQSKPASVGTASGAPAPQPKIGGAAVHDQLEKCNADEAVWGLNGQLVEGDAKLTEPTHFSTYALTKPLHLEYRCGNNLDTTTCKDPHANLVRITRGVNPDRSKDPRRVVFHCMKR